MVDVVQLQSDVDTLNAKADALGLALSNAKSSLDGLSSRIDALVAAGTGATPAQLQALDDEVTQIGAKLDADTTAAGGIKAEADAKIP